MVELAVTDTHSLLWYGTGVVRRLGREARRLFERADAGHAAIFVPTFCLVEIAENARLGRISLDGSFVAWEEALFGSGRYFPIDLTREIVRTAERLYGIRERGDRLIAASAVELGAPLITRDPEITKTAGVTTIW
jgi:PIN domain nuclease of toxin-antitoxin system